MEDAAAAPSRRRHLLDGGFALLVLALAVLFGYLVFSPRELRPAPAAALTPPPASAVVPVASPAIEALGVPLATGVQTPGIKFPKWEAPKPPDTRPWPAPVRGRVFDEQREPLAGASVVADGVEVRTGEDGAFALDRVSPGARLIVKMPGYAKAIVEPTMDPVEATLKPQAIKAVYLTYYGVNHRGIRGRVLDLIERTELNAVVIDVKGDRGWILYPTEIPLALSAGAQGPATMRDFADLMADLKARGVYTIARIVAFKDNVLAAHRPDLAIIDTRTGQPWIDNEKLAWVDPFREEVWAYNIAIAREAVRRGFDEVQFDYMRFPTDGRLGSAGYSKPNTRETRLPTIAAFLERARREIGPTGAFLAVDLFGYTAFNPNDTDIGQRIEEVAPHVDYLCPMVYPSGYHLGIPGFRNPVAHPYEVVHESVRLIRKRAAKSVVSVRPWLQDFRDYAFDHRFFGVSQVQAQVRAAAEAGGIGWMLWNPRNAYTAAALGPKDASATTGEATRSVTE